QPADWIRFFLSLDRPEARRTNFTMTAYDAAVRKELQGTWLRWLRSLGERIVDECGGAAPATGAYTAAQKTFFCIMSRLIVQMEEAFYRATFSPSAATRVLCELVRSAERFADAQAHVRGVEAHRDDRMTGLALELAAARSLATMAAPLMPQLASRLWS